MAKNQKKKIKEIIDRIEVEPVQKNLSETGTVLDEVGPAIPDTNPRDEDTSISEPLDELPEGTDPVDGDISPDDLLEDVRRSLIEENAPVEKEKKPRWWQKLGAGKRKEKTTDETIPIIDAVDDIAVSEFVEVDSIHESDDDADESIDELIEMLEVEEEESSIKAEPETVAVPVEEKQPEVKVDVDELKKRAFRSSAPGDKEESFSDVRAVALEDGEEVFVEVEVKTEDPVEDRIKSFENALRPYRRYINFGVAFIGLVAVVAASALIYRAYLDTLPPKPVKEVSNLPYPVIVTLPGPISFNLGRGVLDDGRWNPRRPEWLEGTEICRWIAIPYSRQLEAVVRTLTRDDKIEIGMSNSDRWSYDVFSITQMSIEDMQKVSANSPCLLLVLADERTATRWVVTAYP